MNPMLKVSAAVLIAAMSAVPVLAAVDTATVVMGTSADIVPVTSLDAVIGKWSKADLKLLEGAASVNVFDTKTLYTPADLKLVGEADTRMSADLVKFRAAIDADAMLKAWFSKNKLDVSRVIAITDTGHKVDVFLY
ncbi:MAG: hypothetical protein HY834_00900 [Devosia nanyangense]|uniref:Uncharacterized protein n=1 Tax=Devosia nanyangense TaxID=1228055 RepID=A0A933KZ57_9HYPH|nr:hypothetical protein [Devosia nanyangense]